MLTAGIDIGSKNIKVVILKDDKEILALTGMATFNPGYPATKALNP